MCRVHLIPNPNSSYAALPAPLPGKIEFNTSVDTPWIQIIFCLRTPIESEG